MAMKGFWRKKKLMTLALVGALGLAVYLNVYMTREPTLTTGAPSAPTDAEEPENLGDATFVGTQPTDPEEESPQPESVDFFEQARENRASAREEALGIIQEVLDSAQASAEDKSAATLRATAIAENVLQESNIENLILAKGFTDSVVYIDQDRCSVVVKSEALQQQESLQILEIVVSQSAVTPENVQIMASKT